MNKIRLITDIAIKTDLFKNVKYEELYNLLEKCANDKNIGRGPFHLLYIMTSDETLDIFLDNINVFRSMYKEIAKDLYGAAVGRELVYDNNIDIIEFCEKFVEKLIRNKVFLEQDKELIGGKIKHLSGLFYKDVRYCYEIPRPFDFLNHIDYVARLNNIYRNPLGYYEIFSDFHHTLVNKIYGMKVKNYRSPIDNPVENFKYMLFADGRTLGTIGYEKVCFYNDMTSENTFYLDINIGCTPDSMSNLLESDKIIYNGVEMNYGIFKSICAKATIYDGVSLFNDDILLINLHKYLCEFGTLQLLRSGVNYEDLVKFEYLFRIEEKGDEEFILTKI